jgi:hypothetical protein
MPRRNRLFSDLAEQYAPNVAPRSIPKNNAIRLGRLLVQDDYKIAGSYVVERTSELVVSSMLRDLDKTSRNNPASSMLTDDAIVGPYYTNTNGEEYCPIGIAIWQPKAE